MTDAVRTARLLLAREARAGAAVDAAAAAARIPVTSHTRWHRRAIDRFRLRSGLADHLAAVAGLEAARRAALGLDEAARPRLLLRVDEFPHAGAFSEPDLMCAGFGRVAAELDEAGVPYLLAALPRVARDFLRADDDRSRPLTDRELEVLHGLDARRVQVALHGLDHRTRHADPRRRSELTGLDAGALRDRVDRGLGVLDAVGLEPAVFVPPFNHLDRDQLPVLAERFEVVCGGPETVRSLGLRPGPVWTGETVLLPSYPPVYGTADELLAGVRRLLAAGIGLWVPLVLHWQWEHAAGLSALRRLLKEVAPLVEPWDTVLDEVRWSRGD